MKKLTILCALLIISIAFTNCEDELEGIDLQSTKSIEKTDYVSLHDLNMAGVDLETYYSKNPEPKYKKSNQQISKVQEINGLVFYYEDGGFNFPCDNLNFEDFSKGNPRLFTASPLDSNTDDAAFSPGDIHPEISFESSWTGFYMWNTSYYGMYNSLYTIGTSASLTINFLSGNVNSASMKIGHVWHGYLTINIAVYGLSNNLIGNSSVNVINSGEMWGVTSNVPIKKIVLSGAWPMIDDISFGNCNQDSDGDGCYDNEDPIMYSNMETTVNIDSCDSGVDNKTTGECGIMMSDMIDELEQDTYKNHGQFVSLIAQLINVWTAEGLITEEEKGLIMACAGKSTIGQNKDLTYVPDDNFEQALIDLGYDDVLDDYVITANINTLTFLDVSNRGINDLTGIEDFTALIEFYCNKNQLSNLDIKENKALQFLFCDSNQLTKLDVRKNIALQFLFCSKNELTNLSLNKNSELTWLSCGFNNLTSLNIADNTKLEVIEAQNNQLESLELGQLVNLNFIGCYNNQLTSLDVSQNVNLSYLGCFNNLLDCIRVNQGQIDTKIGTWDSGLPLDAYKLNCE